MPAEGEEAELGTGEGLRDIDGILNGAGSAGARTGGDAAAMAGLIVAEAAML